MLREKQPISYKVREPVKTLSLKSFLKNFQILQVYHGNHNGLNSFQQENQKEDQTSPTNETFSKAIGGG